MKKIIVWGLMGLIGLMSCEAMAQNRKTPRPTLYTVNFESHHGESFNVFIDGEIVNRMPQGRVVAGDVTDRTHEVVVVLKRPEQKAAVLQLLPGEPTVLVNVVYDERTGELSLYTPSHNRAENRKVVPPVHPVREIAKVERREELPGVKMEELVEKRQQEPVVVRPMTTEADVSAMVVRMKGQPFDADRLAMGKVIVASSHLTAAQIARLAETIDYSSSQVEFLKYAYTHCIDKKNYTTAVSVLTFSSDRKKVLDYIATQK